MQVGDTLAVRLTVGGNDWKYLMIEDPIPSGTESIARDDLYELDERPDWWGRWFSNRELRDDRTTFFNLYFPQGQHEYVYLLKVVNPGSLPREPDQRAADVSARVSFDQRCVDGDGEMTAKHSGVAKLWLLNLVGNAALLNTVYCWLLLPDAHGWQVAGSAADRRLWRCSSDCGCALGPSPTSGLQSFAIMQPYGAPSAMLCGTCWRWQCGQLFWRQ